MVKIVFDFFEALLSRRPTIQPGPNEWTNLAAVVAVFEALPNRSAEREDEKDPVCGESGSLSASISHCAAGESSFAEKMEVISLATGTKCVAANAMSEYGDLIHDSHAEVLARRLLMR